MFVCWLVGFLCLLVFFVCLFVCLLILLGDFFFEGFDSSRVSRSKSVWGDYLEDDIDFSWFSFAIF